MALQSTSNAKVMPELSMLTFLIQAAAALKNNDGDTSLHGYVETHGLTNRRVLEPNETEVDFAVLDAIGDTLLQNHQVLAISSYSKPENEKHCITVMVPDLKADSDMENPAEHPINIATKFSSIRAAVVPNPNRDDCSNGMGDGSMENLRQITNGKSMWDMVKMDPLHYAAK